MKERYKDYAPALVRIGVGIVFFLFGISQITRPQTWLAWLPNFVGNLPFTQITFLILTGIFNLIVGVLLIIGIFTKIAALLSSLHLIGVIISLGYNDISIRDFGLLLAALSIFFNGPDKFCIQKKKS